MLFNGKYKYVFIGYIGFTKLEKWHFSDYLSILRCLSMINNIQVSYLSNTRHNNQMIIMIIMTTTVRMGMIMAIRVGKLIAPYISFSHII